MTTRLDELLETLNEIIQLLDLDCDGGKALVKLDACVNRIIRKRFLNHDHSG